MSTLQERTGDDQAAAPGSLGREGSLVVGIGAARSSIPSLARILAKAPRDCAAAFIVVVQQDGGLEQGELADLLADTGGIPAEIAADGASLEPGRALVVPFGMVATVSDDRLVLRPDRQPGPAAGAVDTLAVSLANDRKERAVLVVLAGLGSDGTLGTAATKDQGGLAIAERIDSEHRSAAAATDIADFTLDADAIAERIAAHARHLGQRGGFASQGAARDDLPAQLSRIAAVLRGTTGHDFHGYKHRTFQRRVQRRMQVVQAPDAEAYIALLRSDPAEVQHLFQDLLIGVTQFFRDQMEFAVLEREVIPALFQGKGRDDRVRIWVLGCATGEEAYSIAILLREHMARHDLVHDVQIFATDIDGRALASARAGRFSTAIERDVSAERLARWFVREGDTYCVCKELREICIFSAHNIIRDAPFSRMDLISCRNLLIYLKTDLQDRVIPLFHFALRPGGVLFLGPSENVTRQGKLFKPIDRRHRLFRRQDDVTASLPDLPLSINQGRRVDPEPTLPVRRRLPGADLSKQAERIVARHAPAYVVVDDHHDVLHFSAGTGRFLEPAAGAANLSLLNLVHRDLRLELRGALQRAAATRQPARADWVPMGQGEERALVHLIVEPIADGTPDVSRLAVLFQDAEPAPGAASRSGAQPGAGAPDHLQPLEDELRLTKERLQAAIEELETTNEELKASNEEYQSLNEELQSANEELETSKEELQSVNEELQTVNGELAHRVSDLARANSDLKNVMESTQIAIVFVDNDLRVRSFTPAVTDVFHLIDSDLGRPIAHIAARVPYPELADDVRQVLRTLGSVERELSSPRQDLRYLVRVLPYRSVENVIAGAVLTFLDVTAAARAEQALRDSEERFRMMAGAVPAFLFTASPELVWNYANPRFYEYTGLPDGAALGAGWMGAIHPDDLGQIEHRWHRAADAAKQFEEEFRIGDRSGEFRWFLCRASPQRDSEQRVIRWFGSLTDIDARRRAEARQRLLLAELQHRVKNILAVVRAVVLRTQESSDDVGEFVSHLVGRLGALARTQVVLSRTGEGSISLDEMIQEELVSHGGNDGRQLTIEGPPVVLHDKAAETLGLALHELTTNAIKYGALSHPAGRVDVGWRVLADGADGEQRLILTWQESGMALPANPPDRIGFGRELIEKGLPYQLAASTALLFRPEGISCVIDMPLQHPAAEGRSGRTRPS